MARVHRQVLREVARILARHSGVRWYFGRPFRQVELGASMESLVYRAVLEPELLVLRRVTADPEERLLVRVIDGGMFRVEGREFAMAAAERPVAD